MEALCEFCIDVSCGISITGNVDQREVEHVSAIVPISALGSGLILGSLEVVLVIAVNGYVGLLSNEWSLINCGCWDSSTIACAVTFWSTITIKRHNKDINALYSPSLLNCPDVVSE